MTAGMPQKESEGRLKSTDINGYAKFKGLVKYRKSAIGTLLNLISYIDFITAQDEVPN